MESFYIFVIAAVVMIIIANVMYQIKIREKEVVRIYSFRGKKTD